MAKNTTSLVQEQKQVLRQSPQQIMLGKLLEMNGIELEEKVRNELEVNPALKSSEETEGDYSVNESSAGTEYEDGEGLEQPYKQETAEEMQKNDYRSEDDIPSYRLEAKNYSVNDEFYIPEAVEESTLSDYLLEQMSERELTEKQKAIADYLIGSIDSNGYMLRSLQDISDDLILSENIDASVSEIDDVFQIIRSFDPAGVGAVNLRDCLLLQLERLKGTLRNRRAYEIIDKYFDAFSKKHYDKIIESMQLSRDEFEEAYEAILPLNPKPGNEYSGGTNDNSQHINPDFRVEVQDDRSITLTLLNRVPDLQIEECFEAEYGKLQEQKHLSRKEREQNRFIIDKYESAEAFINALKQRQKTLYSIGMAIVKWQSDFFFTEDEMDLRPMALRDISEITGFDQSVISRATAKKYLETETRIYPLKTFFVSKITNESGEDISSREVQAILREIINNENKDKPYSDEQLVHLLKAQGYDIARRTVAKYRDKMQIPVARLRKEL